MNRDLENDILNNEDAVIAINKNFNALFEKMRDITSEERKTHQWLIPVILFLVAQFGAGIWWAADVSARLTAIESKVETGTVDRYHGLEAAKDFALRDSQITELKRRCTEMDTRVKDLERSVDRLLQSK